MSQALVLNNTDKVHDFMRLTFSRREIINKWALFQKYQNVLTKTLIERTGLGGS